MSIASEITSMGENLKKDYQSIANLGADLTNVDKNIENIAELLDGVYDRLPKTEFEEGESVTLENTLKAKLDFDDGKVGHGQASQETTQGYNLLELKPSTLRSTNTGGTWDNDYTYRHNGITFTIDYSTGKIKASGTSSGVAILAIPISVTQGNTYRISGCPTGGGTSNYMAYMMDTTSFTQSVNDTGSGVVLQSASYTNYEYRIRIANGYTANNIIFEPMVVEGSTAKAFEKYTNGASPSPNWEQEIKYVRGKNLLKLANGTYTSGNVSAVVNNGIITLNGTSGSSVSTIAIPFTTTLNGEYTLSANNEAIGTSSNWTGMRLKENSSTTISSTQIYFITANASATFTLENKAVQVFELRLGTSVTYTNYVIKPQLEQGSQATPYLPYNTIEEVVSGKNLARMPLNTFTSNSVISISQNGEIKVSGTPSQNWFTIIPKTTLDKPLPVGDYTFSRQNLSTTARLVLATYDKNDVQKNYYMSSGSTQKYNFTTTDEIVAYGIFSDSNSTSTNLNFTDYIMIEKGTTTGTNYEPYKTPKTYQFSLGDHKFYGIGTYRDYILRTTGKNLLNPSRYIHAVVNATIGSTGTLSEWATSWTTWIEMKPNQTYVFSGNLSNVNSNVARAFVTNSEVAIGTSVTRVDNLSNGATYTNTGGYKYLVLEFLDVTTYGGNWQIEEGSTASDYQPYGVGNWYKVGKIGEVQFANVNNIYQEAVFGVNKKYFFQTISTAKSLGNPSYNFLCEILSKSNGVANDYSGFFNGTNIVVLLNDSDTKETATSKYTGKALYYVLANPTYTPITGTLAEQLEEWWNGQSLDGTTIIEGNGDLPMIIKVRGLKGE